MKKIVLSLSVVGALMFSGCATKEESASISKESIFPDTIEGSFRRDNYIVDLTKVKNCPDYEIIYAEKSVENKGYIKSITIDESGNRTVEQGNKQLVNSKEVKGCISNVNKKSVLLLEVEEQKEHIKKGI